MATEPDYRRRRVLACVLGEDLLIFVLDKVLLNLDDDSGRHLEEKGGVLP